MCDGAKLPISHVSLNFIPNRRRLCPALGGYCPTSDFVEFHVNSKEGVERAGRAGDGGNEKARKGEDGRLGIRKSRWGNEKSNLDGGVWEYWEVGGCAPIQQSHPTVRTSGKLAEGRYRSRRLIVTERKRIMGGVGRDGIYVCQYVCNNRVWW